MLAEAKMDWDWVFCLTKMGAGCLGSVVFFFLLLLGRRLVRLESGWVWVVGFWRCGQRA